MCSLNLYVCVCAGGITFGDTCISLWNVQCSCCCRYYCSLTESECDKSQKHGMLCSKFCKAWIKAFWDIPQNIHTHTTNTHTWMHAWMHTHTHTHTVEKCLYCKFCQTKPKSRWQMQINDNRMLYLCTSTICTLSQWRSTHYSQWQTSVCNAYKITSNYHPSETAVFT